MFLNDHESVCVCVCVGEGLSRSHMVTISLELSGFLCTGLFSSSYLLSPNRNPTGCNHLQLKMVEVGRC